MSLPIFIKIRHPSKAALRLDITANSDFEILDCRLIRSKGDGGLSKVTLPIRNSQLPVPEIEAQGFDSVEAMLLVEEAVEKENAEREANHI